MARSLATVRGAGWSLRRSLPTQLHIYPSFLPRLLEPTKRRNYLGVGMTRVPVPRRPFRPTSQHCTVRHMRRWGGGGVVLSARCTVTLGPSPRPHHPLAQCKSPNHPPIISRKSSKRGRGVGRENQIYTQDSLFVPSFSF